MPLYEAFANVSLESLGLENVDNTHDLDKPISTAVQEALTQITAGAYQPASITSVTDNYTATADDQVILADVTTKSIMIQLPNNSVNGKIFTIKRIGAGVNTLKVSSTGKTVDSQSEVSIAYANQSFTVICYSTNYFII
jgi:hypothetical protein